MQLLSWIEEVLLPLIGDISPDQLLEFEDHFWFICGLLICHFFMCVPYHWFCKVVYKDGGILPWTHRR